MSATGTGSGSSNKGGSAGGRGGTSSGAFGQTLYYATTSTSGTNTTAANVNALKAAAGYNSFGMKRDLPYSTVMGPSIGGSRASYNPNTAQLQSSLQSVVAQSQRLSPNRSVNVAMDGNTVVLQGYVDSPRDRRIAEGIMRVTPGVRDVRNELQVKNPDAQ
jgi:osmotically-inducible protein OsmY